MLRSLPIKIPELLQAKLQTLRTQGFTASGYIRALLERELADVPPTYPGQAPIIRKAKPNPTPPRPGAWQSDGQGGLRRRLRKEDPHGTTR